MKVFMKKRFVHKILIALIIIISISMIFTKQVHAVDLETLGGVALDHVMNLFVAIGDGVMGIIQENILKMDESLININTESVWWAKLLVIIAIVAALAICIVSVIMTAGASVGFIGTAVKVLSAGLNIVKVIIKVVGIGIIAFPVSTLITEGMLGDNFYLSLYQVTPYEIFSNKLLLLDVNFFEPKEDQVQVEDNMDEILRSLDLQNFSSVELYPEEKDFEIPEDIRESYNNAKGKYIVENANSTDSTVGHLLGGASTYDKVYFWRDDQKVYKLEMYWSNSGTKVIKRLYECEFDGKSYESQNTTVIVSTAKQLSGTIAQWYYTLRNIAILISMVVLLYIGIRIITSSVSDNKAKYKQMLADWLISICLIFMMQYIMIFANYFVDLLIEVIDSIQVETGENEIKGENLEEIKENYQGVELFLIDDSEKVKKAYEVLVGNQETAFKKYFFTSEYQPASGKSDADIFIWPAENFMQQARMKLQLLGIDEGGESTGKTASIGWKLIFVVLVVYTVIFLWTYLKRIVYLAFLTVIAPFVALTYPIDKITDGKAQAFDSWLKEYIFNLLIQPMHLLLYMILIGVAMDLASQNILYVVVALGFMVPAENLVRRFFGFKGETPGKLAGVAGAALMMTGFNRLTHIGVKHGGSVSKSNGGGSAKSSKDNDIKTYGASGEYSKYDEAKQILLGKDNENNDNVEYNADDKNNRRRRRESKAISSYGLDNVSIDETVVDDELVSNNKNKQTYKKGNSSILNTAGTRRNRLIGKNNTKSITDGRNKNEANGVLEKTGRALKATGKVAGGVLRASGKYVGQRLVNKGNSIRNEKILGTATGLVGAGIGLTAGAIAGIAGGDPSKAFQYATAGAVGGFSATKGLGQGVAETFSVNEKQSEEIKEAFYGDEYLHKRREMAEKEYKKKEENVHYMKTHLKDSEGRNISKREAKKKMESEATQAALRAGIYDIKDIATINQLVDSKEMSVKEAVNTAAFKKELKENPKKFGKKAREDNLSKLKYNFIDKGFDDKTAEENAEKIFNKVKLYWKVRDDITENDLE